MKKLLMLAMVSGKALTLCSLLVTDVWKIT